MPSDTPSPTSSYYPSSRSSPLSSHFSSPPPETLYKNTYLDNTRFIASPASSSSASPGSRSAWSSREPSEPASSDEEDGKSTSSGGSESTLEEDENHPLKFGHPLERIPRHDDNILYEDLPSPGFEIEPYYYNGTWNPEGTCQTFLTARSHSSLSVGSSAVYDGIDYDALVESLLMSPDNPFTESYAEEYIIVAPPPAAIIHSPSPSPSCSRSPSPTPSGSRPPAVPRIMIKRIPRSSQEYHLLLKLNQSDLRADPWNPAPHLRCAVERDTLAGGSIMRLNSRDEEGWVFLCMEALRSYDKPPLEKVGMWVDFFRQILEGLSFLHEHDITLHTLSRSSTYMVDLSSAPSSLVPRTPRSPTPLSPRSPVFRTFPPPPSRKPTLSSAFDRASYPVRYYVADFSKAEYHQPYSPPSFSPTSQKHRLKPKRSHTIDVDINNLQPPSDPFKRDVFELGRFFESVLAEIPSIAPKLRSLITAMTVSGFAADDARKLFEALCRSIDGEVFEMPVGWIQTQVKDKQMGAAKQEPSQMRRRDQGAALFRGECERALPVRGQTISLPVGNSGPNAA